MEKLTLGEFADALNKNPRRSRDLPNEPFAVVLVSQDGSAKLENCSLKGSLLIADVARQATYVDGSWGNNLYALTT
jgi:hypothetical protein